MHGNCHVGFFDGVWKDFPGDLSTTKEIRQILPFRELNTPYIYLLYFQKLTMSIEMMRNQLWKLEGKLARPPNSLRVQLWVTVRYTSLDTALTLSQLLPSRMMLISSSKKGHSLGGAYATNCWAGLLADLHFKYTTVRDLVTFGSPRVGDKAYSTYAGNIKGFRKSWRFVNGNDVVPGVPLWTWKFWKGYYYHIDTLVKINETTIELGPSELKSKTAREKAMDGEDGQDNAGEGNGEREVVDLLGKISLTDHGLNKYWSSLKTGVLKSTGPWP